MNFDFSEDEKMVSDQARRFLQDNCDFSVNRSVLEGGAGYDQKVWQGLADMGLLGATIPEAYGGVGAGYLSTCLVAQQVGAHLAPIPYSSTIYQVAEALIHFGTEAQKQQYLPAIAEGKLIGAMALVESMSELTRQNITTRYSDGKLNGKKLIVTDGGIADVALVLAATESGSTGLYLVDLTQAGVQRETVNTVDPSRDSATMSFTDVAAEPLGDAEDGWNQLQAIQDRAAVMMAFEQIGGAERALNMAVEYARGRFAFGRPIGSFQALKHMMADMFVALRLAESNCFYAAWALSTNSDDLALAAATARVSATQAFQLCARDNIQVHGGMGFTWEFDCHLYYRRSNYLTLQLGGLSVWESKLVDALPKGQVA
ncbi:MAG: acyl-CoA/acyl-ACP dehydrogenase [Pseudomonadales bacterium]|nr:acyl-CoA/acyl-ACP dehydrogenase [Pseudomonadales bacterium]